MKKFKKIAATLMAAMMAMALPVMAMAADDAAETVDLDGTYHARLGIQGTTADSVTWMERIGYYQSPDGDALHTGKEGDENYVTYDSVFDEVEIAGNGTYTVTMKLTDVQLETITQLQVATDIPNTGDITFTDLSCTVNGLEKASYSEVYVDADSYAEPYACLLIYNNWRSDLKSQGKFDPEGMPATGEVTYSLKFTVAGFNYDKAEEETTPAPTEAPTTEAAKTDANSSSSGFPTWGFVVIGVAVVAVVVIVVVVNAKKKTK